jgi:hypothetical protein
MEMRLFEGKQRTVLIVGPEKEVVTVQDIFRLAQAGWGSTRIARHLNATHRPAPRDVWRADAVVDLLHNPIYTGHMSFGRSRRKTTQLSPGLWPALISLEQFALVQNLMESRRPTTARRHVKSQYLLTGLLWCWCGARCWGRTERGKILNAYYRCSASNNGANCVASSIRTSDIDRQVLAKLGQWVGGELGTRLEDELEKAYTAQLSSLPNETDIMKRAEGLRVRIGRLYDAIEAGAELSECMGRIKAAQEELTLLQLPSAAARDRLQTAKARIVAQLERLRRDGSLLHLPTSVQREVVMSLVQRVELTQTGAVVIVKLDADVPEVCGSRGPLPPCRSV